MQKIRLILVNDHMFFRIACRRILENSIEIEIAGIYGNSDEAIKAVEEKAPDIIITEVKFERSLGLQLVSRISKYYPDTRIIILSDVTNPGLIRELLEMNINAYVAKADASEYLLPAIDSAMRDEVYLSPKVEFVILKRERVTYPDFLYPEPRAPF